MNNALLRLLPPLALLAGCASLPPAEVPIEEAQRRMAAEPPVVVADGCLYRRNMFYLNHFIIDESRQLAEEGSKEVIEGFKAHGGVHIRQFVVPLMCATQMPPRGEEKGGRISLSEASQDKAKSLTFPEPLIAAIADDAPLLAAYTQLFAACDDQRYRKEKRYDCPLLKPEQASLLRARLKTSYIVALSVGGERLSGANRSAGVVFGLLLGAINIASDEGSARVRLVNLDTGNLVYSSYPSEFNGRLPADEGGSGAQSLKITDDWVKRMVKPLFRKQR